jgi:hypothetical protein
MGASWTCGRCGVTTSFVAGAPAPTEPNGWALTDDGWRCLACRRTHVVEMAGSRNAPGAGAVRRRALTEFEIRRDPSAPDRVIAKRVGCPTRMVGPIRAGLR